MGASPSVFTSARVWGLLCLPLFPQCTGLTSPRPTPPPSPFPALFSPRFSVACHVFAFPALLFWVSASLNFVRDEVRVVLVFLPTGAGRSIACPFTQEVKGQCLQLNCVIYFYGEKTRGRHWCRKDRISLQV